MRMLHAFILAVVCGFLTFMLLHSIVDERYYTHCGNTTSSDEMVACLINQLLMFLGPLLVIFMTFISNTDNFEKKVKQ